MPSAGPKPTSLSELRGRPFGLANTRRNLTMPEPRWARRAEKIPSEIKFEVRLTRRWTRTDSNPRSLAGAGEVERGQFRKPFAIFARPGFESPSSAKSVSPEDSDDAVGSRSPRLTALPRSQPGKVRIEFDVRTVVVGHSRSRQTALRGDETVDPPPRPLMPADVESGQFGEELQLAVRQVVMDPRRGRANRRLRGSGRQTMARRRSPLLP